MATTVIKKTRIMQTQPPFEVQEGVDIVIVDDVITKVGKGAAESIHADKVIDGRGKTVIPGNVCSHHHYYSGSPEACLPLQAHRPTLFRF